MTIGYRRNSRFLVVLLIATLIVTLSPRLIHNASGAVYQPGVKVGDWWNYGPFEISCSSCPSQPPVPIGFSFLVISESGNNVSLRGTAHYSNGTMVVTTFSGSLDNGSGNLTQVPPIISTGLVPGDPIFNAASAPTINSTADMSYAGASRQVNIVNYTNPFPGGTQVLYYDKLTGINTEVFESSPGFFVHIVLTGTNLWSYHIAMPDDSSCNANDLAPCGFKPLQALVTTGSTVEWDNVGNLTHAISSCTGQITSAQCPSGNDPSLPTFSSGTIQPGSRYSLVFNTTGIYHYYDPLNVGMKALVAVQGNATAPPDFSLSANPRSLSVSAGNSTYASIGLAPLNGFLGLVTLSTSYTTGIDYPSFIGPQGDSFNLGIISAGGTELLVRTSSSTLNGIYTATVTGAGAGVSHSVIVQVNVTGGRPDFTISASPTEILLPPAGNGTFFHPPIITLNSVNGFQGSVQLVAHVSPPGLVVELSSPSPINNASLVLTLGANGQNATALVPIALPSTQSGIYHATVSATSGLLTHTANVTIIYSNGETSSFTIQASPDTLTIPADGQASSNITLTSLNGFSGTVSLSSVASIGIIPIGSNSTVVRIFPGPIPTTTLQPLQVFLAPNGTATATLTVFGNGAQQSFLFAVNVTGTSATVSHSISVIVQIVASPPDFSLLLTLPFPLNQGVVVAGGILSVGVSLIEVTPILFNGTVTLTGQISPTKANGPVVSINPAQIRLLPPGPSFATAQIMTTESTPPGNYTLMVTGTSGTLVHTTRVQFGVLPPPVIAVSPTSGTVGTKVTVHGSGFPSTLRGPIYLGLSAVEVTFDDQSIGYVPVQNGQFDFTFNIPISQATQHVIHAIETFPFSVSATANFTVMPELSTLGVSVSLGSIYFPGDTATISVLTSLDGQLASVSNLTVQVLTPDGSRVTLATTAVTIGLYRATFNIPSIGTLGTYTVIAKANAAGAGNASALGSFEVKPSWLSSNSSRIAMASGIVGTVGVVGFVAFTWRRGYFKRKDELSTI